MNNDHDQPIPLWLQRLHQESPQSEHPPESDVQVGDIRTLFGQYPMPINQVVYVVDVEQLGTADSDSAGPSLIVADVIAIHDDPSFATHNDLIVPREHSQRNLNVVLRLPLLAKVPVAQLSAAPIDQLSDVARSAIESYEFGTVPDSPLTTGTTTNGPRDPRWQFCDETHDDFYEAVDTSWRTYLRQSDVDPSWGLLQRFCEETTRSFTAAEYDSFLSWVEMQSSTFPEIRPIAASPPRRQRNSGPDRLDNELAREISGMAANISQEKTDLESALSTLSEYSELIVNTNLSVSAIDSFCYQVRHSLKALSSLASRRAIGSYFIEVASTTGLSDQDIWATQVIPQHKNIAADVQGRWFMMLDLCSSTQIVEISEEIGVS